jgi:hypothetical protein
MRASPLLRGPRLGLPWLSVSRALFRTGVAAVVVCLVASTARAATPVGAGDFTGLRATPDSSGIVASGGWTDAEGGLRIRWTVALSGDYWTYSYAITNKNGTTLGPSLSHVLLEVSPVITKANVGSYIFDTNFTFEGPQTWTKDPDYPNTTNPGKNNGNPNLPANLYSIKILSSQKTYTFSSTQAPMWGDLYTKSGRTDGAISTAGPRRSGPSPPRARRASPAGFPVPDTFGVERCDDGSDNDGDGLADCADPDCNDKPCQQDGLYCNGAETCTGGTCQPGGDPCPGEVCDEAGDECVECLEDEDCPAEKLCAPTTHTCEECLTNGDCADALFCNGEETCTGNTCQPGGDPCPGEVCDEAGAACVECLKDEDCPAEKLCAPATHTCEDCLTNGDCADALYCNGEETCTGGTCLPGSDPCPGKTCDEIGDACVGA